MFYSIIRIVFFGIIFILVFLKIKKSKITRKRFTAIITFIAFMVLSSFSTLFPVENLFINFKSSGDVYNYISSGKIEDIIYGGNSSLVYGSETHIISPKVEKGYKIPSIFSVKQISKKFDQDGSLDVYNVSGTSDYYVIGIINSDKSEFEIFNGKNEQITIDIKRVENGKFFYFYLKDFTKEHYLFLDGKKIGIST